MNAAPPPWHLASYPRSGNHLLRTLLEYATHRPTLGANPHNPAYDLPIARRKPNLRNPLIKITDDTPIACKSHFVDAIWAYRQQQGADRIILITRDPSRAITSHLMRSFNRVPFVSESRLQKAVQQELRAYLALAYAFATFPPGKRVHVRFETVVASDPALRAAVHDILDQSAIPYTPLPDDLGPLRTLAQESQTSLGWARKRLQAHVTAAVTARIDYTDFCHWLAQV